MTLDPIAREFTHAALTRRKEDDYRDFASQVLYSALSADAQRSLSSSVFRWAAKAKDGKLQPILVVFYLGVPASILKQCNRIFLHELVITAALLFGCDHIRIEGSDRAGTHICEVVWEKNAWVVYQRK